MALVVRYFMRTFKLTRVVCLQDSAVVDVFGAQRGQTNPQSVESGGPHVPAGRLLPHQDTLPDAQDRTEGEM